MMSNPKHLNPLAVVFNVFKSFKNAFYFIVTFSVLAISDGFFKYVLLGILGLAVLFIILGIISWRHFTYEVTPDQIHIKHGIFIRKDRYISRNRIQSIDLTQGIIHRPFGLTKVEIETAGNDRDVDANLSAVRYNEGIRIQEMLKENRNLATEEKVAQEPEYPKRTVNNRDLLIAGATSGSIGVIIGLFGLVFSQIENLIPDHVYDVTTRWLLAQALESLVIFALMIAIILWGLGILGSLIKYGKFQIIRYEKELFITRGLLEKKQMTIPLKRIQAVGIEENFIRQPFGLATIYVVIAGGEIGTTADAHTLLFPVIRKRKVEEFLNDILPEYNQVPHHYKRVPVRALPYYLVRSLLIPIILLILAFIFTPTIWIYLTVLFLLFLTLGYARYRTAGYHVDDQFLTVRFRVFNKETILIPKKRIQAIEVIHHFLHRKQELASFKVSILSKQSGRQIWIKELEQQDNDYLIKWLER